MPDAPPKPVDPPADEQQTSLPTDPAPAGRGRRRRADSAPGDGPPTTAGRKPRAPKGAAIANAVTSKLREITNTVGGVAGLLGDAETMQVLTGPPGERFCEAWGKAAAENPRIRKAIESLAAGGLYGEVAIATAGLLLPIAARHGLIGGQVGLMIRRMAGVPVASDQANPVTGAGAFGVGGGVRG